MTEHIFPIMHGKYLKGIPWDMIESHETQAWNNHQQNLMKLSSRHGLSPCEALAVIEDHAYNPDDEPTAEMELIRRMARV